MSQILDPLPNDENNGTLCCYVNATSQIQVARITNIPNWYFERVVFPGQRLVFEALPEAILEIHCGMMASAILSDTILCSRLAIDESDFTQEIPIPVEDSPKTEYSANLIKVDLKNELIIHHLQPVMSFA
jgi:hypothetical protein